MMKWRQRIHDSLALGAAGILVSLGVHDDLPAYIVLGGVIAVLSFGALLSPDVREQPAKPTARSPELLANYRALLERAESELVGGKDPVKVGAWVKDQRFQFELDAIAYEAMHTHIEDVVLEVHQRRTLTSADPLWGKIDQAADFVRDVRA